MNHVKSLIEQFQYIQPLEENKMFLSKSAIKSIWLLLISSYYITFLQTHFQ